MTGEIALGPLLASASPRIGHTHNGTTATAAAVLSLPPNGARVDVMIVVSRLDAVASVSREAGARQLLAAAIACNRVSAVRI